MGSAAQSSLARRFLWSVIAGERELRMQGSGVVRRGLGWPEVGSGEAGWPPQRASATGRASGIGGRGAAPIPPLPQPALGREEGGGCPVPPAARRHQPEALRL